MPPLPPAELDLSVPVEAERLVREAGGEDKRMVLVGWAADGFPIYGRFAHAQAEMRKLAQRRRAEAAERDSAAALGTAEDTAAGAPAASSAASSHSQPTPATPTLPPATALAPNATRAEERARRDLLLHYLATGQYDEAEALGWRHGPSGDDMQAPLTADDERRAAWIRHYLSSGELPEAIKLGWSSQLVVSSLAAGQMRPCLACTRSRRRLHFPTGELSRRRPDARSSQARMATGRRGAQAEHAARFRQGGGRGVGS